MSTDLHTLSGAYAIDALSPEEAEEFLQHLEVCSVCREEVRELREAAARMGASEALVPPTHLKERVMAAAAQQPQLPPKVGSPRRTGGRSRWTPRLVAAAAAAVLVVGAAVGISQWQRAQEPVMAAPVARVFNASDAHKATMETTNGGTISVATSPGLNEMAVDTDRLPKLDKGQVYQIWAIADGAAHSAGVLEDPAKGAAMEMPGPEVRVAITIEPAGGSAQPTTQPIMSVVPSKV